MENDAKKPGDRARPRPRGVHGRMARERGALTRAGAAGALALLLAAAACARVRRESRPVRFWGLGREGEVVKELLPAFHARHPGVTVEVQQIPWTAAHEKLLTAFVGESLPDVAQIGNTWLPEFRTLGALEDLGPRVARSSVVAAGELLSRHLGDESRRGRPCRRAVVRRHARPLLPQGPSPAAGVAAPPRTWAELARRPAPPEGAGGPGALGDPPPDGRVGAARDLRAPEGGVAPHGGRRRRRVPGAGVPRGGGVLREPLPRRLRAGAREHADRERLPGVRRGRLRDVRHRPVEPRRVPAPASRGAEGHVGDGAAAGRASEAGAVRASPSRADPASSSSAPRRGETTRGS